MFNNHDFNTNGEKDYYDSIKKSCSVIFDAGSHNNSIFVNSTGEVHYFEPFPLLIEELKLLKNENSKSYFNNFGLSDKEEVLKYYHNLGSFVDRSNGPSKCESIYRGDNFLVKRADSYIIENNITNIDFLKIDVEGLELQVLKGFGDKLNIVKTIQFEYGIGTADNGYGMKTLIDYLKSYGFSNFCYIAPKSLVPITDYSDHWHYCNIVCSR